MKSNNWKRILIALLLTLVFSAIVFYITLPALNFQYEGFYIFIIEIIIAFFIIYYIIGSVGKIKNNKNTIFTSTGININGKELKFLKIPAIVIAVPVVILVVGGIISAPMFNAKRYQKLITVNEGNFIEDVAEISYTQIPTLDKDSAERLEMPVYPVDKFVEAIEKTVAANAAWVPPYGSGATLYIRPYMFGSNAVIGVKPADEYQFRVFCTPVGPYFKGGAKPITIRVSDFDRAAPHGTGHIKAGLNYAMSLHAIVDAHKQGYDQHHKALALLCCGAYARNEGGAPPRFVQRGKGFCGMRPLRHGGGSKPRRQDRRPRQGDLPAQRYGKNGPRHPKALRHAHRHPDGHHRGPAGLGARDKGGLTRPKNDIKASRRLPVRGAVFGYRKR